MYVVGLRRYLRQFAAGREDIPVNGITVDVINRWFANRTETPQSRAGSIGRISSLCAFAVRRGWMQSNPCRALDSVSIDRRPPVILTPAQAQRVLETCAERFPRLLPHVVLGLFCGLRPAESERLHWEAIRWNDGVVVVDAAASKVRRRRLVTLNDAARSWLEPRRENSGLIQPKSLVTRFRKRLTAACGVALPPDILRHSAASYLMSLHRDAGRVADELGNSPQILLTHYRELVSAEDAARFWSLRPKVVETKEPKKETSAP